MNNNDNVNAFFSPLNLYIHLKDHSDVSLYTYFHECAHFYQHFNSVYGITIFATYTSLHQIIFPIISNFIQNGLLTTRDIRAPLIDLFRNNIYSNPKYRTQNPVQFMVAGKAIQNLKCICEESISALNDFTLPINRTFSFSRDNDVIYIKVDERKIRLRVIDIIEPHASSNAILNYLIASKLQNTLGRGYFEIGNHQPFIDFLHGLNLIDLSPNNEYMLNRLGTHPFGYQWAFLYLRHTHPELPILYIHLLVLLFGNISLLIDPGMKDSPYFGWGNIETFVRLIERSGLIVDFLGLNCSGDDANRLQGIKFNDVFDKIAEVIEIDMNYILQFFLKKIRNIHDEFERNGSLPVYLFRRVLDNYKDILEKNNFLRYIFDLSISTKKGLRPTLINDDGITMTNDTNIIDIVPEVMTSFHGVVAGLSCLLGYCNKIIFSDNFGCVLQWGKTKLHAPTCNNYCECVFFHDGPKPSDLESALSICKDTNHVSLINEILFSKYKKNFNR